MIANQYHISLDRPTLPEPFPDVPEFWVDPITNISVPKDPTANLAWRARVITEAENDIDFQQYLFTCCEKSILLWFNLFVWTYRQFIVDPIVHQPIPAPPDQTHVPFVTWIPMQDDAILEIQKAIQEGYDIGVKKCRETGASWMCLGVFHWFWLFRPESQLLELSRTEAYVDEPGNAKSLFWKHDYINQWLPDWMCPPDVFRGGKNRRKMHIANELNGSVLDGEATTANAASGDRRLAVLMDEFAKVENGQAMRSATADVTPCRVINSTPCGAGTEYSTWLNSGQIKIIYLPFYKHPEKGLGRYIRQDETTGMFEVRSPWLDNEEKRRSPKEMAQEIFMDDLESGSTFFEANIIEKNKVLFAREPISSLEVNFLKSVPNDDIRKLIQAKSIDKVDVTSPRWAKLKLWKRLIQGRLDQKYSYALGVDLSEGKGASNSVIAIICVQTGEIVGEWADANTPPYEMARIVMAIALWVGGANPNRLPVVIWEMNGPGYDFGKLVVEGYSYPYCYYMSKELVRDKKLERKFGWHASTERKELMLSELRRKLAHGGIIIHSELALNEAMYYIRYPGGKIGPACLLEESEAARKTHGDRVIAVGLALLASGSPTASRDVSGPKAPKNCVAWRRQQSLMRKRKKQPRHKYGSWRKVKY
jgi:hypothetical protein